MKTRPIALALATHMTLAPLMALAGSEATWGYPEMVGGQSTWTAEGWNCTNTSSSQQSPIDFTNSKLKVTTITTEPAMHFITSWFDAHDQNASFLRQMRVAPIPGAAASSVGTYTITGYHFHRGKTEHTFEPVGKVKADIELHIKTMSSNGPAVFSIGFYPAAAPKSPYQSDALFLKASSGESDIISLLPLMTEFAKGSYYAYVGSLTSPPCTGGVQWYVLKQPLPYNSTSKGAWTGLKHVLDTLKVAPTNSRTPFPVNTQTTVYCISYNKTCPKSSP